MKKAWPQAAWWTVGAVVALLALFHGTVASTVAIWMRSETFAHGWLIFPISAWLIWKRRQGLANVAPVPDARGLVLLALLGLVWLAASVARVLVVQQLAVVAMIPALVFTLLGAEVTRRLSFPLAYLLLAVPMGEFLIPPLMDFTADFTVAALQLTGIPVYREGTFFTIPSGNWSVVEGCSGLRYLIASFTLGTLYGYLTYRSLKKRLLFALVSVVVPILANGLRAYMIVMIAHLSDMKLALGVDHYIYGWVFFGLVMMLLFWIGSFWREDKDVPADAAPGPASSVPAPRALFPMLSASAAVVAVFPAWGAALEARAPTDLAVRLEAPPAQRGWQKDAVFTDWRPHYQGADRVVAQAYRKGDHRVLLVFAYYRYQRQDAELVNSQNVMVRQKHPVWSNVGEALRQRSGVPGEVMETKLRSAAQRLLVWQWHWLNGPLTVDPYWAKFYEARARLLGRWDDAAAVILASPYEERPEEAAAALEEFVRDMGPAAHRALAQAAHT